MEDWLDEDINHLLNEYGATSDISFPEEPNFSSSTDCMSPLPLVEEILPANFESSMPTFPIESNNFVDNLGDQCINSPRSSDPFQKDTNSFQATDCPFQMTNDQFSFVPTPNHSSTPTSNNLTDPSVEPHLVHGSMDQTSFSPLGVESQPPPPSSPPPPPKQERFSLASYFGFQNQSKMILSNFGNPILSSGIGHMGTFNPMEQNWEAITCYLSGQVRPGPDVPHVYKCSICDIEFPNAQAFGGHMSSHSKTKGESSRSSRQPNKSKRNIGVASKSNNNNKGNNGSTSKSNNNNKKGNNDKNKKHKVLKM